LFNKGAIDRQLSNAWRDARDDLGIRVVAPFSIALPNGPIQAEAHVLDFGSPSGAIAMSFSNPFAKDVDLSSRYWRSLLGKTYRTYRRESFVEMLNDWGWFGAKDQAPAWYTGAPHGYERKAPPLVLP
jgi:hypothetical protein